MLFEVSLAMMPRDWLLAAELYAGQYLTAGAARRTLQQAEHAHCLCLPAALGANCMTLHSQLRRQAPALVPQHTMQLQLRGAAQHAHIHSRQMGAL